VIREIVHQGLVDIMLMSPYVSEQLAIKEGVFRNSEVTPAARANDTTDVWAVRHGCYMREPSQPFRSASIEQIQCGQVACDGVEGIPGANLGLYSITYVNEIEQDREALLWYKQFREEAERRGFRHFLEVFDPNVQSGISPGNLGEFINDSILRTLAGVPEAGRPVFLKIVYHGPRAMEELAQYDPNLVVGILGGGAGTTYDAFRLIHDAQKYGARVALFGRKINNAEHQLAFIEMLRLITDGRISPDEAVRAYHAVLQAQGITPQRTLEEDMKLTEPGMSYDGSANRRAMVQVSGNPLADSAAPAASNRASSNGSANPSPLETDAWPVLPGGRPDFSRMSSAQRHAYDSWRLKRRFE
jgi:hypothetical protein